MHLITGLFARFSFYQRFVTERLKLILFITPVCSLLYQFGHAAKGEFDLDELLETRKYQLMSTNNSISLQRVDLVVVKVPWLADRMASSSRSSATRLHAGVLTRLLGERWPQHGQRTAIWTAVSALLFHFRPILLRHCFLWSNLKCDFRIR